jgi:excisionase family DNA binding protein
MDIVRNGTDSSRELRMNSKKDIMTRTEVASYLRVDKSTVSRLAKSGEISCFKIGTRLLFKSSDVLAFIDNRIGEVDEFRRSYK